MIAFIDDLRMPMGSSRFAGYCRSPLPPIMTMQLGGAIRIACHRAHDVMPC